MGLSYHVLTDFQKWFFFYLIKNGADPVSLKGVTRNMCLGVKMTLDVDRFDEELQRLERKYIIKTKQTHSR